MNRNKNVLLTVLVLLIFICLQRTNAQPDLDVIRGENKYWLAFSDAPNSLYHHLAHQATDLLHKRAAVVSGLKTLSDWEERQKWVQKTLVEIVGPFPEKTPLNVKLMRIVEKDTYRVEHLVYESQPGFYVTSSLYVPRSINKKSKAPAIIYCSGHANEGYRSAVYQHVILNLVTKGFIVFAFDPVGQGERLEYFDADKGRSIVGGPTAEHSYAGTQAFITGSSEARYMIWDGIRAVDYLLTRKEIDPERIGITGRSGGGTQSAYIAAFDQRIKAAAPECYITGFFRLLQSIGPQDAEQNFSKGIQQGIDHADLLEVRAPKPTLMITTTRDMFSIQGARETAGEISRIYEAYGKKENFSMVEDDAPHASTKKNREAMYSFFQKNLGAPGNPDDSDETLLTEAEMKVTPTGQVSTSLGGETVFSLNRKEAEKLADKLKISRNELRQHLAGVLASAKKLSGYQAPEMPEGAVFNGRVQAQGYVIEKYFLKGEGDYVIPYLLMVPDKSSGKSLIYLHPSGKAGGDSARAEMEWFVTKGFTVLAPDLVGIGETGSGDFQGDSFIGGMSHNLWYSSILIGRSIVGIRAGDVVRLTRLLQKQSTASEIYALARNEMSPVLLHAAAFDPTIGRVAIINSYASYRSLVTNRFYNSSFIHNAVPGVLQAYDLPDLAACLAPRKLLMAGLTDALGKPLTADAVEDLSIISAAFKNNNSADQLKVVLEVSDGKLTDLMTEWIK